MVRPAPDAGERRRERHPYEPGAVAPARRQAEGGHGHAPRRLAVGCVPVLAARLVLRLPQAHEEPGQALQLFLAALPRSVPMEGVPGPLVLLACKLIRLAICPQKMSMKSVGGLTQL